MAVLELDGNAYSGVPIIEYEVTPEILDGPGTGRTSARYWPMVRDPQGTLINLSVTYGLTNSENSDFVALWNKLLSLGEQEFVYVRFLLPAGEILAQDMYVSPGAITTDYIEQNGTIYNSTWQVKYIAKEGL